MCSPLDWGRSGWIAVFIETDLHIKLFQMAELKVLILSSLPKTFASDSIPTFFPLKFVDELLPFLVQLCNTSLAKGFLRADQKQCKCNTTHSTGQSLSNTDALCSPPNQQTFSTCLKCTLDQLDIQANRPFGEVSSHI